MNTSYRISHFVAACSLLASLPTTHALADATAASPLPMVMLDNLFTPPTAASRAPELDELQSFSLYGHWDTDFVSNLSGGLRTGRAVDSVAVGGFTIKGDRFGLANSVFNFSLMATRAGNTNARFIGADTNPSNIEGDRNRLVLNTAFWEQNWLSSPHLGLDTRLGVFDLNAEFNSTDNAAQLLNSSFGLDPTLTDNFATSTFPQNGTGLVARIGNAADPQTAPLALRVGLIQGDVNRQTRPLSEGVLNMAEGQWRPNDNTAIKLGGWQKRGNDQPSLRGAYLSAETNLFKTTRQKINGFVRAGYADGKTTQTNRYMAAGINWQSPLRNRPDDDITFGVASVHQHQSRSSERVFEASYIIQLTDRIYLQPDVQYIQNPHADQHSTVPNAWVAIVRLHIE